MIPAGVITMWLGLLGAMVGLAGCASVPSRPPLLEERFDGADGRLPPGWRVVRGTWHTEGGALIGDSLDGEAFITAGDPGWKDYEVQVTATFMKVREPTRWLSVLFRVPPGGEPPWFQFPVRQGTDRRNGLEFAVRTSRDRWDVRSTARGAGPTPIGRPCRLRVAVVGEKVRCTLDGEPVIESFLCVDRAAGGIGLGVSGCVARFDDIVVSRLSPPERPPGPAPHPERCICVAHRGFSARAPENTMAAVLAGIEAGAEGIEFDVYSSRDRVPVLMHDRTVDRTTNGTGEVSALTLAELETLDAGSWKDPRFAGEPVPMLVAVLNRMRATKAKPVIEIKPEGIAREVVDAVRAADMTGSSVVISFQDKVITSVKALGPEIPCGLVVGERPPGAVMDQAETLAARAKACGAEILDLNHAMLSPALVAELKRRGFQVWCWTVNEGAVMAALARWGVDAITTDRPDLFMERRREGFR